MPGIQLDPLTRIVNVNWGGRPTVVSGVFEPHVRYYTAGGDLRFTKSLDVSDGAQTFGRQKGVALGPQGTVAIASYDFFEPPPVESSHAIINKLDRDGNLLWRTVVLPYDEDNVASYSITRLTFDHQGNVIFSAVSGLNFFAVGKLAADTGNVMWIYPTSVSPFGVGLGFNSIRCDRSGNIAAGRFSADGEAVYKFSPGGSLSSIISASEDQLHYGIAFDNDGNLFVRDGTSLNKYDPTNALLWSVAVGTALTEDGLDTDGQGNCWVAVDGVVKQYSPDGLLLNTISLVASGAAFVGVSCTGADVSVLIRRFIDVDTVARYRLPDGSSEYAAQWSANHDATLSDIATRWLS